MSENDNKDKRGNEREEKGGWRRGNGKEGGSWESWDTGDGCRPIKTVSSKKKKNNSTLEGAITELGWRVPLDWSST